METPNSKDGPKRDNLRTSISQASKDNISMTGNVKILGKYEGANPAMCCAVFRSNKQLAVGWSDGTIEIRDSSTFEELKTLESPEGLPATCLSANETVKTSPQLLASYASGHTILWDIVGSAKVFTIKDDRQTLVNTFSIDFESFATSGSDGKINIHDARDGSLNKLLQGTLDPEVMDGHTDRVFALRFHPTNGNDLLSGGWDDTVQFWDVRYPYSRNKIHGPHICGNGGIEFLNEDTFVTASWRKRKSFQVWDYTSGTLEETIVPDEHTCFLYCCTYLPAESILLVGGSHQNMLRIVDFNARMTIGSIHNLKGAVYFAKELPTDSVSFHRNICFCAENSIYQAEIDI